MLLKGKIIRWQDDRGFGFIRYGDEQKEIFLHISALGQIERRPQVGDTVVFEIQQSNNGKLQAAKASIEGLLTLEKSPRHPRSQQQYAGTQTYRSPLAKKQRPSLINKLIAGVIIASIVLFLSNSPIVQSILHPYTPPTDITQPAEPSADNAYSGISEQQNYSCTGKSYCSQMSSCAEARYYLAHCPFPNMDGDGDGIPCERQWCSY